MFKKLLILTLLLLSSLQAGGIFSTLPYEIKIGMPLPKIVEDKMTHTKIQYQLNGKFAIKFLDDSRVVESLIFAYGDFDMELLLPKVWRRAGLELSFEYSNGTPFKYVKNLLAENGAKNIEESEDQSTKVLIFTIDNNKQYELVFYKQAERGDHGKGLAYITITLPDEEVGDEYY